MRDSGADDICMPPPSWGLRQACRGDCCGRRMMLTKSFRRAGRRWQQDRAADGVDEAAVVKRWGVYHTVAGGRLCSALLPGMLATACPASTAGDRGGVRFGGGRTSDDSRVGTGGHWWVPEEVATSSSGTSTRSNQLTSCALAQDGCISAGRFSLPEVGAFRRPRMRRSTRWTVTDGSNGLY